MPLRGALHALLLLASGCALVATAAAATCPELPPAPDGTRRFALSAGALSTASPWQSLAYNDSRGWGPEIRVALGETVQIDVTNDGIEVRPTRECTSEPCMHACNERRRRQSTAGFADRALATLPIPPLCRRARRCTGTGSTWGTPTGQTAPRA